MLKRAIAGRLLKRIRVGTLRRRRHRDDRAHQPRRKNDPVRSSIARQETIAGSVRATQAKISIAAPINAKIKIPRCHAL